MAIDNTDFVKMLRKIDLARNQLSSKAIQQQELNHVKIKDLYDRIMTAQEELMHQPIPTELIKKFKSPNNKELELLNQNGISKNDAADLGKMFETFKKCQENTHKTNQSFKRYRRGMSISLLLIAPLIFLPLVLGIVFEKPELFPLMFFSGLIPFVVFAILMKSMMKLTTNSLETNAQMFEAFQTINNKALPMFVLDDEMTFEVGELSYQEAAELLEQVKNKKETHLEVESVRQLREIFTKG